MPPLDAILRLSTAIAHAQTLDDIFDAALVGLREACGFERASILLFDADGVIRFKAWRGLSDAYRAAVEGHSPWQEGEPAPDPILLTDVRADPSLQHWAQLFACERIGSLGFVPLVSLGRVIGKLTFYREVPSAFTRNEVHLAKSIGLLVGLAVERTRAAQDLQLKQRRVLFTLDAANMGTWEWDVESGRVEWSENLERIHGLPPGTFDGTVESYQREIHPDDRARVFESLQRAIAQGTLHDVEYRIISPDGVVRWVHGKGRVERDPFGRVRMTGVCMDITGRKAVEAQHARLFEDAQRGLALEASLRQRLTVLTEGSHRLLTALGPESIVAQVLSLAGQVVEADAYAVWRRVGHEWRVIGSRGLSPAFASQILPDSLDMFSFDRPVVAADVSLLPTTLATIHAHEGFESLIAVPLAVLGVPAASIAFYYRSAHRPSSVELRVAEALGHLAAAAIGNAELYAEQQALRQRAQDANRVKDEFLATLSHELRTPLNVILGRARMLRGRGDPQTAHTAGIIERNSQTLAHLVDDLLDLSRFTLGQFKIDRQPLQLGAVVEAAVQAVQPAADAKGIVITVENAPDLPAVMGDATRLQQVVWNLLSNAVKFTPPSGQVRVSTSATSDGVSLAVADSGEGIAAGFLPQVFDMFTQAEQSASRRHGGMGLGLSIVRRLVELHGGRVQAASAGLGRGATFTVTLPHAAAAAGVRLQEPGVAAAAGGRAPTY